MTAPLTEKELMEIQAWVCRGGVVGKEGVIAVLQLLGDLRAARAALRKMVQLPALRHDGPHVIVPESECVTCRALQEARAALPPDK